MKSVRPAMHVATIKKVVGERVYTSHLLRRTFREGGKVKHQTLANLSALPLNAIDAVRRALRNEPSDAAPFRILRSRPHGHVEAVLQAVRSLGVARLLGRDDCRERRLVLAMIAQRILAPASKLASARLLHSTSLADQLQLGEVHAAELYRALGWLRGRQAAVERTLARRHLSDGGVVLYDVSSSCYEGETCPLARFGHDRDGRRGRPIIVYGVLADRDGRPVAVEVYPGNAADPSTVPNQVEKLRSRFGLERVVLVGDRGMLTSIQIEALRRHPGIGWISALRSEAIRGLIEDETIEPTSFDETDLAEITSPDFPGERLIACYNPALATRRAAKREELLQATELLLARLQAGLASRTRTPLDDAAAGERLGAVKNRRRVGKHFECSIENGQLTYRRNEASIERESLLDGIYVIRTSEPAGRMGAADVVRKYKSLAQVERAFRCMKGVDLMVRPIFHRVEPRVEAHFLLCLLAYYVEWHMRTAWAPLLFADEELTEARATRDPVKPAESSAAAREKKKTKLTSGGLPAQSFGTLLSHLSTRCMNTCSIGDGADAPRFEQTTLPDDLQREAFRLLGLPA